MTTMITWPTETHENTSGTTYSLILVGVDGEDGEPRIVNGLVEPPEKVLASVFLGSIDTILRLPTGDQFEAEYEHLTQDGKTVYDTLHHVYGRKPQIATYTT